jgi:hypothetical protein
MTTPNQAPSSMQQIPQQHISQVASGTSTARTEGPHLLPFASCDAIIVHLLPLSLLAHSTLRSNRPAFLDAYFRYRKFNEGKPRLDIDGAERDAALWYTTFHDITLDQLQQANDYWYPLEQETAPQAPPQPPMQLHTPSPSSPSPSPEAPAVQPHVKPDPSEAEDQEIDEGVDDGHVQDARLQAFLEPVMMKQGYHLPPSASIQELLCNLHSDSIASFIHDL